MEIVQYREKGTAVVLPYMYKRISGASLEETAAIKCAIQFFQARDKYFALISEKSAVSCMQVDCRAKAKLWVWLLPATAREHLEL